MKTASSFFGRLLVCVILLTAGLWGQNQNVTVNPTTRGLKSPNPLYLDNGGQIIGNAGSTVDLRNATVILPSTPTTVDNVVSVATVAALRGTSVSGLPNGAYITLTGYAAANDSGAGGLWVYDSSSSATDNSGTVVAPTVGSGRWLRVYSGAVNVRWFGAKGDGSNDDTTAIANAIAVLTAPGSEVYLPAGTYKITSALTINFASARLRGDGPSTIIKASAGTFNLIELGTSANGVQIANLQLYGATTVGTTTQCGIYTAALAAPDYVTVTNVIFSGPSVTTGLNVGIKNDGGDRWEVTNCRFLELIPGVGGNGYGILLGAASENLIANNIFYCTGSRGRHCVYISGGSSRNLVTGNTFTGFMFAKVPIYARGTAGQPPCVKNVVSNNVSYGGGSGGDGAYTVEGYANENVLDGNRSYDYNGYGVFISNESEGASYPTVNNVVSGGVIVRSGKTGILVEGADKTRISGVRMHEISDSSAQTYFGIALQQQGGIGTSNTFIDDVSVDGTTNVGGGVGFVADAPAPSGTVIQNCYFPNGGAGDFKIKTNGCAYVGINNYLGLNPTSGNQGDASVTIYPGRDEEIIRFATTLTANRTCTINLAATYQGAKFRIWRPAGGAYTLNVTDGTLSVLLPANSWCDVVFNAAASAWQQVGYGPTQ